MSWGFITHWLKWVSWERMGSVIIVSLVTSTHPAKKMGGGGLRLCRHHFTKGLSSSLQPLLISLGKSASWPGKEMGGGRELRGRGGHVLPPTAFREKSLGRFGAVSLGTEQAARAP